MSAFEADRFNHSRTSPFIRCAPRTNRSSATNPFTFVCARCSAPRRVVGRGACREASSGLTWSIGPESKLSQALHLPLHGALRAQTARVSCIRLHSLLVADLFWAERGRIGPET